MVKKQSISHLSLKPQRKARKPRVLLTHTYSPEARIAKWFRYCRNYAHETQKRPGMDAGARRTAPWTARFDGFVGHRYPIKHNSYSIFAVQRSSRERVCTSQGSWDEAPSYCQCLCTKKAAFELYTQSLLLFSFYKLSIA